MQIKEIFTAIVHILTQVYRHVKVSPSAQPSPASVDALGDRVCSGTS
jgi:hypothetical protein